MRFNDIVNHSGKLVVENEDDSYEIKNLEKLDHILVKLTDMIVKGQKKDPEYFGMVAACVLDPDNNIVARLNCPGKDGKRIHAERAAMIAYYKKYGEIPKGSIIITTLSPCCDYMDDRDGESCTDLINASPVHKVYCGYMDPTQDKHNDRQFTLQETNNPKIREICQKIAEEFLNDVDESINEQFTSKQQVIDAFVRKARRLGQDTNVAARRGAAAWENGFRGKPKDDKPTEPRPVPPGYRPPYKDDEAFDIGMGQASHGRELVGESIDADEFKKILKKFLPIAKKIIKIDKLPKIILKKKLAYDHQPTMGRFFNETYKLELAIANRQPVDILRTLAHELVHARQDLNHISIDPTTGSPEENEANVVAGIVMRHFNKMHPEFLSYQPVEEGKTNGRKRIC